MFIDLALVQQKTGLDVDSLEHYPSCVFPNSETRTLFGGRNCSAGKTGCTIGFDGMLRPCSHAHKTYGHIVNGLDTAWGNMAEWRDFSLVPKSCKESCSEFPIGCSGGCRVEADNCGNSLAAHDPYCTEEISPKKLFIDRKEFDLNIKFIPSKNLKFRQDNGGHIVYLSIKNWLLVDHILLELLKSEGFTAEKLASCYGVDLEKTFPTIHLLFAKKIISEKLK